ncbi:asparagine synthase (glutamine-hydrolyzing) [Azoarcus communis]|uniref:asparagine synthase (glutamine-hydrolyzing) n=1 Tax=Parazoarcus communis TaxID=41977 RepID=UPI001459CFC0|nr:asparagine synthase (glutamine-hydrolyzing) [Parazoarcus communis]NMG47472.1 asparagine synthase (glutamine-hydrolyzing) [Parazoarcus communis]
MCGIGFLFDSTRSIETRKEMMEGCLARQFHRGPDDGNIMSVGDATVGHRRLSIIDIGGSVQPMHCPSERYWLSFNGEIYNYKTLRDRLLSSWNFRTEGDTEVLLAGLIVEGTTFLQRMEGMWAFALYDSVERTTLLARDRMGKKPLYYEATSSRMCCASELPAMRMLASRPWEEDPRSTADYFAYGFYLPGFTAYRDVHEVLPGHWLKWKAGRGIESHQPYWSLQLGNPPESRREAARQLRHTLVQAVERRLVADVEVGAFLSGGIDSSLVCSIVRRELQRPLKSFTIGFSDPGFDERSYAREVALACSTTHHEEVLTGWDEHQLEKLVLMHVGQPFGDSSLLPTWLASHAASRHVKVALSGDGADELFSGYQRYQARVIWRWYMRLPPMLRSTVEQAIRLLPEPMAHHSRSLLKKAHLFVGAAQAMQADTASYVAPRICSVTQLRELTPGLRNGHEPPGLPEVTGPEDIRHMMLADALIYLPQDIMLKVDRASMAASLESRTPFLDREVVELAFSIPGAWHRRTFSGKRMLRETFSDLLPNRIWKRRKQGFSTPVFEWFRGKLGSRLEAEIDYDPGPTNPAIIRRMLAEHRAGRRDHATQLWAITAYLLWRNGERRCK